MKIIIVFEDGRAEYNGYIYSRSRSAFQRRSKDLGTHTKEEWLKLAAKYDFRCCKCGGEVIGGIPTKDHIMPIRLGGSDSIENIQPLCRQCNLTKGNRYIDYRGNK